VNPEAEPDQGEPLEAADLELLVRQTMRMSSELEEAWSNALDAEALVESRAELAATMGPLVTALTDSMQRNDEQLEATGIDPRFYAPPMDAAMLRELTLEPDAEKRRQQLVMAQMISLERFVRASGALDDPGGEAAEIERRSAAGRWWESGAFSLVQLRGEEFLRITAEVDSAVGALLAPDKRAPELDRSVELANARVRLAEAARSRGDAEAALLHVRVALCVLLAAHRTDQETSASLQPGRVLSRMNSLEDVAPLLRLFDEACERLGRGELDLGVAVPMADCVIAVVSRITVDPPIVELQKALAEDEEESGS
jgi:hypothetical protein